MKRVIPSLTIFLAMFCLAELTRADAIRFGYQERPQQLELLHSGDINDAGGLTGLRFNALGQHFDLQLNTNRRLLRQLDADSQPDGVGVYKGALNGAPGSWARIVYDGHIVTGLIHDGSTIYALERSAETGEQIAFRLDDVQLPPHMMSCAMHDTPASAAGLMQQVVKDAGLQGKIGPGATQNLDISVVGDFEFTSDKGASEAATELLTRMNNVDGIFSDQLGVQLTVRTTETFASASDPFTDESDAGNLLDEIADYRRDTASHANSGLSHLFTGRDLDGSTAGIAYTNAMCSRNFGVGLTQATRSVTVDSLIAAHEIGHNFGAPHDGTPGACEDSTGDWLMSPSINGSNQFSSCTVAEMQAAISRASCLTPVSATDIAIALNSAPTEALLGNTEQVVFAVDSVGTEDASSTDFTVTIPAGVTLDSIVASSGSCTSGAGSASCDLGTIAAGSGATVTVTATLGAVGNARFVGDVSANTDASGANNQRVVDINVLPAVDLVVITPAIANVVVNQSTTLRITVENRADVAATAAQVTITPDAGLTIDSATWIDGDCAISGGNVSCDAANLGARANTTITLGVTATATGSQGYDVSATASETDRDTATNAASSSVSVANASSSSASSSDDGGGGSIGLCLLVLFATVLGRRRSTMRSSFPRLRA